MSGGRVANLSIATDESYINRQTGGQGRQDRVAPGRHLPGRADRHVRQARREGPAGLHRRQAADARAGRSRTRTATGSRPRSCSSPADASSSWTSRTATVPRRRPTRPWRATPAPPLRPISTTGPKFRSSDRSSSFRFLPPHLAGTSVPAFFFCRRSRARFVRPPRPRDARRGGPPAPAGGEADRYRASRRA